MLNHLRTAAIAILVVGAIVALSTASAAQKVTLPKYDATTEVHIAKATVVDTKEVTLSNGQHRFRLMVKIGNEDPQEVCLCPKAFLETMDSTFAKDDVVEIVGSKVESDGKPLILAREVTKGQNTLVLRDKKGEPVWTWMEKKTAEGK